MRKLKVEQCVYCGEVTDTTRDHVIPECLFVKPYPPNLITVPSCDPCNNAKSKDDDFLRDYLTCDILGSESPVAKQVFAKVLSSDRRGSSIIAKTARAEAHLAPLHTHGGIYVGDFPTFSVDGVRIRNIFERLVRGLYYDARKQRFPDGYIFEMARYFPWQYTEITEPFQRLHPNGPRILGDVFGCQFLSAEEDPFTTIWLIWFYERVVFSISATNPQFIEPK